MEEKNDTEKVPIKSKSPPTWEENEGTVLPDLIKMIFTSLFMLILGVNRENVDPENEGKS